MSEMQLPAFPRGPASSGAGVTPLEFFDAPPLPIEPSPFAPARRVVQGTRGPHSDYRYVFKSDAEVDGSVVKSAHRVLQVFEFFSEQQRSASASEIAVSLGFPQSSTSMLLRSLVSLGYLKVDHATRLYTPTLRLSLLGAWRPEPARTADSILDLMAELHERTGERVMLAEQHRHFVRYIRVMQSADPERIYYVPLGTLRPICTTAFGQALLTLKSTRELQAIVHRARSDDASTDHGLGMEAVISAVRHARDHGYACTTRLTDTVYSYQMAVLLPSASHDSPVSVGISCYGERSHEQKHDLLEILLKAVDAFEKRAQVARTSAP